MAEALRWYQKGAFYETYVDKFAGNFKEFTAKLDYLQKLGITCIWLLPHYPSPMVDDGYDVSDYMNVRPELGTLEDFETFVKAVHARGMRIVVDLVLNHTSTQHPWFLEAKKSKSAATRNLYLWSETAEEFAKAANPFFHFKPKNWIFNPETKDYYFASFYPQQADLNWDNPEVLYRMLAVMDFWLSRGVDGFRLDAVPFLIKREKTTCTNLPEAHDVIKKLREFLNKKYPDAILLAEANGTMDEITAFFGKGDECHMAFHFPLMLMSFLALRRSDPLIAQRYAEQTHKIPSGCQWATFLRNHDELSMEFLGPNERQILMDFADPLRQYATKFSSGTSVRMATIFKWDKLKMAEAFKLFLSLPGTPVIYYGEEIGMDTEELAGDAVDMRRSMRGKFDWKKAQAQTEDKESLFNIVAELLKNRTQ